MNEDERIVSLRMSGAHIGQNVFFGPDVYIESEFASFLTIEDGVVLSRGVCILLHDSALNNVASEPIKFGRTVLQEECYIGANATILCGVEIGSRAVVGACSLVTKDIPAEMVAYGHPALVRGSIQDLIAKHRELQHTNKQNDRFSYLDLVPWRARRDPKVMASAKAHIHEFIQRISRR